MQRYAQIALGLGIALWVALLFLAPGVLFPIGRYICHQRPDRSFFIHGHQMAVCARCTGLYVGAAVAVPFALLAAYALSTSRARRILAIAALPTLITWSLEFAGFAHFSNLTRFVAALPLGFTAGRLVLTTLAHGPRPFHKDH